MKKQSKNSKKFILLFFLFLGFMIVYLGTRETAENKKLKEHLKEKETTIFWYDINVPQYQSAVIDHNDEHLPDIKKTVSDYGNNYIYSQKALISQLVYDGYDVDKAIKAVKNANVDWYKNCSELSIDLKNIYKFSKSETADMLIEAGFDSKTVFTAVKDTFH